MSLRAAIRAKVEAATRIGSKARRGSGEGGWRAAISISPQFFLRYVAPRLVAVGGLSGTGKSALAEALAPRLGRAPGALWLRSDVERKAMFGVEETVRLDAAYAPEAPRRSTRGSTTRRGVALSAGHGGPARRDLRAPIHARRRRRRRGRTGVAFDGLFLEAPLVVRLARVGRRARRRVRRRRVGRPPRSRPSRSANGGWSAIDASGGLEATVARASARLGLDRPSAARAEFAGRPAAICEAD